MPWKEKGLETMRKDFVERVLAHEKSKSALCREYGISRPTGDKWIARYLAGEKLEDLSPRSQNQTKQDGFRNGAKNRKLSKNISGNRCGKDASDHGK